MASCLRVKETHGLEVFTDKQGSLSFLADHLKVYHEGQSKQVLIFDELILTFVSIAAQVWICLSGLIKDKTLERRGR